MTTTVCCSARFLADAPTVEVEGATVHVRCEREFRSGLAMIRGGSTVLAGVARWDSNGRAIPADLAGAVTIVYGALVAEVTVSAGAAESAAFLAEYRQANIGRRRSAEELFEMRAAFGPGATVVDVITGEAVTI